MNWYRIDSHDVLQRLDTSELGLSDQAIGERLETYGLNRLAQEGKISRLKIVLHQFMSPQHDRRFPGATRVPLCPTLSRAFRTVPLTVAEWAGVIGVSATVLVAVELDKWLRRIVQQ